MRLLFDAQAIQSSSSQRGIGRYSLCLLRALARSAGDHQVEVLLNAGDDRARLLRARTAIETFLPARAVHVYDADWPWRHHDAPQRRRGAETAYAAAVASLRPDVLLVGSVFEGDQENVLSLTGGAETPTTAAILYDLIPATDPGTYLLGPGAEDYWRRLDQLRRADLLLSISDYSRAQAHQALGAACPQTTTIWGGPYTSGDFPSFETAHDERPDLALPRRFVLSVGGDHPRKNLDRLVLAWARVPRRLRQDTALVLACGLNPGTVRRLRRTARRAGLTDDDLLLTGRVSERRLDELYQRALAFVFPSTEEGLGMPPIEAMANGLPTTLARSSSLVELVDEPEAYFDPEDTEEMASILARLLGDDAYLERLRQAAARSAVRLDWQQTARRTWDALVALPTRDLSPHPQPAPVGLAGVAELCERPAPVRLSAVPPQLPEDLAHGALPIVSRHHAGMRAALAPALAIVLDVLDVRNREDLEHELLAAGVVDLPLVAEAELADLARHDPVPHLARGLPAARLTSEQAADLTRAVSPPPRWTLRRSGPVWLLLTASWTGDAHRLQAAARTHGAALVVAAPGAEALARYVDLVAVEHGSVDLEHLVDARCRGALVVELVTPSEPATDAQWWRTTDPVRGWDAAFAEWAAWGTTTGWPWGG